jgi:hypothetical protein
LLSIRIKIHSTITISIFAAAKAHDSVQIITSPFEEITRKADVVYLEFCLHEMNDPCLALTHARSLAPNPVVFDRSAGSAWAFYAAEDNKVRRSEALQNFGTRRRVTRLTVQHFRNHAELAAKRLMIAG